MALIEGIHLLQSWNASTESFLDIRVVLTTNTGLLNPEISTLIAQMVDRSEGCSHIDFVLVEESIWHELSDLGNAPHLISLVAIPESFDLINFDQDVVVLDGIQDAGNVGTILRTSLAAGFRNVIALKGTANIWSPKVLRAAMGVHSYLKIKEGVKSSDFVSDVVTQKISARLQDAKSIYDLSADLMKPVAWVFGNEGQGVSELLIENSLGAYIPINAEVESLNVASAAAVCLFETTRVRRT
jgi:TrmH family RNA methyltransferase